MDTNVPQTAPPAPEKKKSKKVLWIVLIIVAIGCIGPIGCMTCAGMFAKSVIDETDAVMSDLESTLPGELVASDDSETAAAGQETEVAASVSLPEVSAEDLTQAFTDNEIAAGDQWKGKRALVTGTIHGISRNEITDQASITLKGLTGWDNVMCSFKKRDEGPLASLKKGEEVTLEATISGFMMGSVTLKDCKVAE